MFKHARSHTQPRYPQSWCELPVGEAVRDVISAHCDRLSERIFGYHLVKLGNLSSEVALPSCPISHQINQCQLRSPHTGLIGKSCTLPYVENSVDGFLLCNELDFAQDPHEILREVDRVITQSGYVIITGFNPFSATGLGKYLPLKKDNILHDARFFSAARIIDWLSLLSFEVLDTQYIIPSSLFWSSEKAIRYPAQWRMYGYQQWFNSVYVIFARKRTWPMTTIKPKWKLKPSFSAVSANSLRSSQRASTSEP